MDVPPNHELDCRYWGRKPWRFRIFRRMLTRAGFQTCINANLLWLHARNPWGNASIMAWSVRKNHYLLNQVTKVSVWKVCALPTSGELVDRLGHSNLGEGMTSVRDNLVTHSFNWGATIKLFRLGRWVRSGRRCPHPVYSLHGTDAGWSRGFYI